jgi:hypothetical protein
MLLLRKRSLPSMPCDSYSLFPFGVKLVTHADGLGMRSKHGKDAADLVPLAVEARTRQSYIRGSGNGNDASSLTLWSC